MDDLDKIIGDQKDTDSTLGDKKPEEKTIDPVDEQIKKKEEHLANLNVAIKQANDSLREKRKAGKEVTPQKEEKPLIIDTEDPNSKAWLSHIDGKVSPLASEMERVKDENRTSALRKFLSDKPNLAKDPEKVKQLMGTYERIRSSTELNEEAIATDLKRAFGAEFADVLLERVADPRLERAKNDILFSEPAVTRGSTSYTNEREPSAKLSEEDRLILSKWGMTPEDWVKEKKKYS